MPVRVVDVQSALRLTVEAMVGGLPTTMPLQLDGIRLIGPPDHALTKLKELCPPGAQVILEIPGERLETDAFGLAKAWVLRDFAAPIDPASPAPAAAVGAGHRTALQIELMRSGWAVLEDQGSLHRLPPHFAMQARQAMQEARTRKMGAYSLPGFQPPEMAESGPGLNRRERLPLVGPDTETIQPVVEQPQPSPTAGANGF